MRTRRWLPATGIGVALGAVSVLGALAVAWVDAAAHDRRIDDLADVVAADVVATIDRHVLEVELLAATAPDTADLRRTAPARLAATDGLVAVALAELDGRRLPITTAVPADVAFLDTGRDLREVENLDLLLGRVMIEADATAGAPFEVDGRAYLTVGAPILGDIAAPEAERRASVRGAILGVLDGDAVLSPWPDRAQLIAPNGASIGAASDGARERTIEIRGRIWTLLLDPEDRRWPPATWVVLGGGLAVSVGAAVALHVQVARRRRAEEQAATRSLQLERIAETGAGLQQSLDLAQLLPGFAVTLSKDFDLDGVMVSLFEEDGSLVETFATGDDAGASIDLPLRRGGRAIGVLSVRPGRVLDTAELGSLQALADLLAVAMSNAQLYEREQEGAARLRDLDALKNAFLGTVSHELRTSMTAIMGFGELLADAWDTLDDDRRREMANRIRRSAGSLRHLVDDLLDFARLEQERLRVSPRRVDLAGIVRQTVDNLGPLLGRHQVALDITEDVVAWADPVAVERILANLVSNAAKYSPEGTTVHITIERVDDAARLVVADEGPGIPAEERQRIFARFYRLDTPESVRTRGAGIGLAILHDFAERSGAVVAVDDNPGGGARFTVDFPIRPTDDLAAVAT